MNQINLSYVIVTRNKLSSLTLVLERLLAQAGDDEEIIIVDGGSTDGTPEYLQSLYDAGRIHQFVSEPDKGEAHGWNKALLQAKGEVAKLISDDDAFYWPVIQACKRFMLAHPEVDVLATPGFDAHWGQPELFREIDHGRPFEPRDGKAKSFVFSGLGLMLRRESLPLTGLFHTGLIPIDTEFALRVTSGPVNLAWCTGYSFVRILNPQSLSFTQHQRIVTEMEQLYQFYLGAPQQKTVARAAVEQARGVLRPLKNWARNYLYADKVETNSEFAKLEWERLFAQCEDWLEAQNRTRALQFLSHEQLS